MTEVELEGKHYMDKMCIGTSCVNDFAVFGIENAEPFYYSSSDGFLGLGVSPDFDQYSTNSLDQMARKLIMKKKTFGVYTTMHNNDDPSSQIRFGGYNN